MKTVHAANSSNTVLVGDDTYLLVLPCYHASIESHDLFFCPEPKKNTKQPGIWNIKVTKQRLGPEICQHILFLHVILGCDTTSRLHGIGKGASLKKLQASNSFRHQAKVLHIHSASKHDVTCAGEKHWWYYTAEIRLTAWTPCGISGYVGRSHRARLMFIYERYHHFRSSNVPPSSCVPASPAREGICWWTSSDRVGVVALGHGVCAATDRPSPCSRKCAPSDQV